MTILPPGREHGSAPEPITYLSKLVPSARPEAQHAAMTKAPIGISHHSFDFISPLLSLIPEPIHEP